MKLTLTATIALIYVFTITSAHLDRDNNKNYLRAELVLNKNKNNKIRNKNNNARSIIVNRKTGWSNHDSHHHLASDPQMMMMPPQPQTRGHSRLLQVAKDRRVAIHNRLALLTKCAVDNSSQCHEPCQGTSPSQPLSPTTTTIERDASCDMFFDFEANITTACCSACTPEWHDLVVELVSAAWNLTDCSWAQELSRAVTSPTTTDLKCAGEIDDLLAMPSLEALEKTITCLDSFFRDVVVFFYLTRHGDPSSERKPLLLQTSSSVILTVALAVLCTVAVAFVILRRCRKGRKVQEALPTKTEEMVQQQRDNGNAETGVPCRP